MSAINYLYPAARISAGVDAPDFAGRHFQEKLNSLVKYAERAKQ
jgi:hypothetical protein